MANEKQFYEFKLDSDTTTQSGTLPFLNDVFLDIINYDEVNPYYFNSGFRENLDHVDEERSQKARFGLKKMLPYTKIKLWKWSNESSDNGGDYANNQTLNEFTEQNYEVTDSVFVDGDRYIMVVSADRSKMWIFKQIHVTEIDTCVSNNYESGFLGHFVNISKYIWTDEDGVSHTQYYYPFDKCVCDKFTVAAWGKGQKVSEGTQGVMKVELVGNDLIYYFFDRSGQPLNAAAGDYIYINEGPLSGQILPLGGETSVDGYSNAMITPFAWTGVNLTEGSHEAWSDEHGRVIYKLYGDIIHFCTSDGILHLNYSYEHPSQTEVTKCGSMFTNTVNGQFYGAFKLSSMIYHHPIDSIVLYDVSDGDVKIGLNGYLKFYFKALNQFFVSNEFTDIVEFQDYLILLGPSKTGLAYVDIDPSGTGVVSSYYREIGGGYLNRGSWVSDGSTFIMANEKGVRALDVVANYGSSYYSRGANRFPISADWVFQTGPFVTDISQFNRHHGDYLGMSMVDKQFKMYISNENGTIIWIKSVEHNYWRQHILTTYKDEDGHGVTPRIKGFAGNLYIGNGIYERGGKQDIKTYLSFMFGDQTLLTPKQIQTLKLAFGRDSWITNKNTVLEITYVLGGKTYTTRYSDWSSSLWIKEMMDIKQTHNLDGHIKTYQNEIELNSGEGHGKRTPDDGAGKLYTINRIKAFEEYEPSGNHVSDFNDQYELANFGTVHTDLGYMFDTITFKLITYGQDCIEFYGALMRYRLTDETGGNLDNSLTIYDNSD